MSTTPLCTPDVLESSGPTVRTYVNATYKVTSLCIHFSKEQCWFRVFHLTFLWLFSSLRLLTVVREKVSFSKVSTMLPLQSDESWRWRARAWRPDGVRPLPPLLLPLRPLPLPLQQHPKHSQRKQGLWSRASLNGKKGRSTQSPHNEMTKALLLVTTDKPNDWFGQMLRFQHKTIHFTTTKQLHSSCHILPKPNILTWVGGSKDNRGLIQHLQNAHKCVALRKVVFSYPQQCGDTLKLKMR